MNNEINKSYSSRTKKRQIQEEMEKTRELREKQLEENRKELKKILFNEKIPKEELKPRKDKPRPEKKVVKTEEKKPNKKPKFTNALLAFTMVLAIAFGIFLIYDSANQINQIYQIINAILILITIIAFLTSYKRSLHYNKTKASAFTALCLIVLMTFNTLYLTNILKLPTQNIVPDFENVTLTEAIKWAEANNITYEQSNEFSDTTKKYNIISQNIKPNTLTNKIKKITFSVSNGPDYDKEVIITDMSEWKIDEAVKVIDENFLNNVTVNFEENEEVERDTIISQSKSGTLKRNDDITITVSLGTLDKLGEIAMKNLKNQSLFKATLYLNRNNIDYELKYDFSNKIEKGKVIKSSVKKGETVKPGDKVTLTISKGKKITVPELKNKKMSEVTKWLIKNNLKINYSDKYDNNIKSGHVIEATYKKGDIIEEETTIGITVSKGKLKMPSFSSLTEFKIWAEKYQIKYEIKEEFNDDVKKGEIINFSIKKNKSINLDEGITAYVSKGKAIEVPDFSGKTKTEIQKQCNNRNINCTFINVLDNTKTEGTAINQSIKAGEKIAEGDNIQISLATKSEEKVTKTTTSKTYSSSNTTTSKSNSTKTTNNSNTANTNSNNTAISKNVFIQTSWLLANAPSENCNQIRSGIQNQISSKVNITCSYQSSDDGRAKGKIHENSLYQANKSYTFTENNTYTFILVE